MAHVYFCANVGKCRFIPLLSTEVDNDFENFVLSFILVSIGVSVLRNGKDPLNLQETLIHQVPGKVLAIQEK